MRILATAIALALLAPSAEAAVVSAGKQRALPTIANVRVERSGGFRFDVKKTTTTDAYDIWGRLTDDDGEVVAEWFTGSMKFRSRAGGAVRRARFATDIADLLRFEKRGTYVFTVFACPANLREPTASGCATAEASIEKTR